MLTGPTGLKQLVTVTSERTKVDDGLPGPQLDPLYEIEHACGDKEFVEEGSLRSISQLARDINRGFKLIDEYAAATDEWRIATGRLLIEARKHVKARAWQVWCVGDGAKVKGHIHRSMGDIRKVMALAGAPEPVAAAAAERQGNMAAAAKSRAKRADVSALSKVQAVTPLAATKRDYLALSAKERNAFKAWLKKTPAAKEV